MTNPSGIPDKWQIAGHDQAVNPPTENLGLIITGMGGENQLLRYFVAIATKPNSKQLSPKLIKEIFLTLFSPTKAKLEKIDAKTDNIRLQILICMDYSVEEVVMKLIETINKGSDNCLFIHYLTTNTEIPSDTEIQEYINEVKTNRTVKKFPAEEMRIAKIFDKLDPCYIPSPSIRSLPTYYKYLIETLELPVEIKFEGQDARLLEIADIDATEDIDFYGLLATIVVDKSVMTVPLAEIDLIGSSKSEKLIDDYQYWFENFR